MHHYSAGHRICESASSLSGPTTVTTQVSLKPQGLTKAEEGCQWVATDAALGMAEIVRLFNEEKETRGSMRISPVTSKRHRAYELIEAKLDAAESQ